ncbi:Ig-like domain-containing protein [Streptomyces poonensis]|uniref:Carbohydrate-binding protein n=1 Tax=Streptomyces poonensis TaxID=68255 RepID=A0A918Q0B9_9ACTN|nr:Ig-like domain-containing protein [Streptomyces poonensis]GGZ29094.1 carbohydrate-binding protein [Streptomyces poonensis]
MAADHDTDHDTDTCADIGTETTDHGQREVTVHAPRRRSRHRALLAGALAVGLLAPLTATTPAAADNSAIGYPVYSGSADPVPELPAGFTTHRTMRAQYDADRKSGDGTDFWMDRLLARKGADPAGDWLFTRGRAVFMKEHRPDRLGFGGKVAYWESIDDRSAYTVTLSVNGEDVTLRENTAVRTQTPSYWRSEFTHEATGLEVTQTKFITDANVAVTNLSLTNTGSARQEVTLRATSPYATTAEDGELTGVVPARNNLTTVRPRFSGDGMTPAPGGEAALTRSLALPAGRTVTTKVQLGFTTGEITRSRPEYDTLRAATPAAAFRTHVQTYNRWWAENLPYIDLPDDNIEKTLYYRWWLLRYNFLDADIPGSDYQFPTAMEGVLGYNNAIVLTTGMFVDDLKYLRDPSYSYGSWVSAGEVSKNSKYTDNPGDPENWSNSHTQYLSEAAWRSYQVHGGPEGVVRNLARYAEQDVRGQLEHYDHDGNGLIEYDWGAMTGNDADAVSFHWRPGHLDRTESAYVHSNARAAASAYDLLGERGRADDMRAVADRVRGAVLEHLWDPEDKLLKHRHVATDELVPWKEINNYYPYSVGLMPTPDEDPQYLEALRLWADAGQYPVFPFFTANQADKAEAAEQGHPGSNNFSVINSTVTFRFLSSVLRNYPSEYIDSSHYKKLLSWNAWAHYVDGDNRWPDQNEFWADGSAAPQDIGYRSWIHHTMLGTTNWTVIEDAAGFRPRTDRKIELWPVDVDWPHFAVTDINYRGTDVAVLWDEPGDGERPYGRQVPEGYSVYLDGRRAFTADSLTHLVYDPATREVTFPDGGDATARTTGVRASVPAPLDVEYGPRDRVTDVFAKAGRDLAGPAKDAVNFAAGAAVTVRASHEAEGHAAAGAVDGFTVNEPHWGARGSGNAEDWYEIDFGRRQRVDDVRLYFAADKKTGGYAEPALYTVRYQDRDGRWQDVARPAKSPAHPRANLNQVRFEQVTTERLRVLLRHRDGHTTGLKEIQAYGTGARPPAARNQAPYVEAWRDTTYNRPGEARLTGVVEDDGLPEGRLDSSWRAADGPEGGTVLFADPNASTTVARFTEPGTYTLELTATDGTLRSAKKVVVEAGSRSDGQLNLAPSATPTASYTSGWESVTALNDGREPASSSDTPRWGSWPQKGTQWVQYTWDSPVRVNGSDMYFFRDAQPGAADGVGVPESWVIEYRDGDDGTWREVPSPDGYGTAEDRYNRTTFASVTTTALRARLTGHPGLALGVQEWKVYAEAPESVREVHVPTLRGEIPELPSEVTLVHADGSTTRSPVAWPAVTEEQVAEGGTRVTVTGLADRTTHPVTATVWVRHTNAVQITGIAEEHLTTRAGTPPALPATVTATHNDGSKDSRTTVTWDPVDPDRYAGPGTFQVTGTVAGTTHRATATVTVTAPG